ncbi:hypothetical protein [Brucella pituitosa]|uniref:hypothetical protein n=1 Tax=Brucella pituitosa TaxID=571256 RepID=UPI003F4A941B
MIGQPAFPIVAGNTVEALGMSFREYASVKFMASIIEADGIQYAERDAHNHARVAVLNADALIEALTRPNGGSNHGE